MICFNRSPQFNCLDRISVVGFFLKVTSLEMLNMHYTDDVGVEVMHRYRFLNNHTNKIVGRKNNNSNFLLQYLENIYKNW